LFRHNAKDIFKENGFLEKLVNEVSNNRCYDISYFAPSWSRLILNYLRWFKKKPFSYGYKIWDRFSMKCFFRIYTEKWMNEASPFVILKDNLRGCSLEFKVMLRSAQKKGCRLVRFPSAPSFTYCPGLWVDLKLHDFITSDLEADINIVSNKWDADYLKLNKQKAIVVGTPKFNESWITYLEERSDLYGGDDFITDKYILVLLKNEQSAIFDHVDFVSLLKEIIKTSLLFEEYCIVLKPHPRQDLTLLNSIIQEYNSSRILISNNPSFSLINKAKIIVTMPSGVMIDALIAGKPVIEYFHFNVLDRLLKRRFKSIPKNFLGGMSCLDHAGNASSVFRVKGMVAPANDPESLKEWLNKFRDNVAWEGTAIIRDIFPRIPMEKAADAIMAFAG
jgi:hypothetical protein